MSLPTLTHIQGAVQSTGSVTPTIQQVIDAIDTALALLTYWEKKSEGVGFIEIGPKTGSPIANFRAIICDNPTTGYASPDTSASVLWCGINPSGGTLSNYQSATPYGGSVRFSGYWKCAPNALVENIYLIESAETLTIVLTDDSAGNVYCCDFGAIITPPNDNANSAESDGRIYGMITSGTSGIGSSLWGGSTNFMGHDSANSGPHMGIFKPTAPSAFQSITRCHTTMSMTKLTGLDGSLNHLPLYYQQTGGAQYYVGRLRQRYATQDFSNRTILTNAAAIIQGYCLSQSISPGTADTITFLNS